MNTFFFFLSELIVNRILIVSIVVNKIFSILLLIIIIIIIVIIVVVIIYPSVPVLWQFGYLSTSWSVLLLTSVTFKIVMSCVAHSLFDFSDWMSVPSIDLGHRTCDNCMFCVLNVLILSRLCITRKLAVKQTWHPMLVLRTGWHRRSYGEKDTDEK